MAGELNIARIIYVTHSDKRGYKVAGKITR